MFSFNVFLRLLVIVFVFGGGTVAQANMFPHRQKFTDVPVIELGELRQVMDMVTLLDVRSKYEYETLHIKGAINVPLTSLDFGKLVREIQNADKNKIVFYCNGGKCKKSYKAVRKAQKYGITNTVAYDAGIYAWAKSYPDHSVLLGKSPMQANEFIENKEFKSRLINAKTFEAKRRSGAQVLDIRDRIQRDTQLFPSEEERAELKDIDRIKKIINETKRKGKPLLVYDKVGKQIRWFQYLLEKQNIKNYYFMKGGSEGYYEEKLGKFRFDQKTINGVAG